MFFNYSLAWFKFFQDCNLPDTISRNYSILFSNNRMQVDMLNELTKELLHEIGICAIGDVLSILKHVKEMSKKPVTNNLVVKRDSFKTETNPGGIFNKLKILKLKNKNFK